MQGARVKGVRCYLGAFDFGFFFLDFFFEIRAFAGCLGSFYSSDISFRYCNMADTPP